MLIAVEVLVGVQTHGINLLCECFNKACRIAELSVLKHSQPNHNIDLAQTAAVVWYTDMCAGSYER
jgi:hypothetical protein